MADKASILVYGRDPGLLKTRTWVFEGAGYRVASVSDLDGMTREATSLPIGLLVLCHSLPREQRHEALALADTLRPEMKRLLLTANSELHAEFSEETTVSAFDGPRAMLAAAARMLEP